MSPKNSGYVTGHTTRHIEVIEDKVCNARRLLAPPRASGVYYSWAAIDVAVPFLTCNVSTSWYRPLITSRRAIMSTEPSTSTSHSNFQSIFDSALEKYKHKTKEDLTSHPLLPRLESCDSPEAILTVLRDQIPGFSESQNGDDGLTKWVTPTVNVLYTFSDTIGQGIGLVSINPFFTKNYCSNIYFQAFPSSNVIFAGIGVLLSVGALHVVLTQPILTPRPLRRLKMLALAETSSSKFLI